MPVVEESSESAESTLEVEPAPIWHANSYWQNRINPASVSVKHVQPPLLVPTLA